MSWFKLDDKGAFHVKVLRAGNEAYGAWCRAGQWCSDHRTNGIIPFEVATLIASQEVWERLLNCGDEGKSGLVEKASGGWQIHDYLDWNPSAEQVAKDRKEVSKKRSLAGKKGAKSKWQNDGKPDGKVDGKTMANGVAKDMANGWQTGMAIAMNTEWQNDGPVPVPISEPKGSGANANASAPDTTLTLFPDEPKPFKPGLAKAPKAPSPTGVFWGVWRKAYQDRYGTRYQDSTADGKVVKRVAELAIKTASEVAPNEPDGAERVMQHWCTKYLADRSEFLTTNRHALIYFERDISKHGNPWDGRASSRLAPGPAAQRPKELVPEPVANPPSLDAILSASIDSNTVSEPQETNQ